MPDLATNTTNVINPVKQVKVWQPETYYLKGVFLWNLHPKAVYFSISKICQDSTVSKPLNHMWLGYKTTQINDCPERFVVEQLHQL